MTIPSFDELLTPLTEDQVLASELQTAVLLKMPVTAWQPGGVVREILEINAAVVSEASAAYVPAVQAGFLDYASGDWLTLEADQTYDVQRIPATFATGELVLYNGGPTTYVLGPGDVRAYDAGAVTNAGDPLDPFTFAALSSIARETGTGSTYTSTTGGTLTPGGKITITIVADVAGTVSNATAGAISALATPISGVFVSNPDTLVAENEESDPALRQRCRESMAKASPNGPADAYRYFATSAKLADGTSAGCTKVSVVQGDGTNIVYCASDTGPLLGIVDGSNRVSNYSNPLAAVDTTISNSCVPTGISETTLPAVELLVPVSMTLYLSPRATVSNADAQAAVVAAIAALQVAVPIGGWNIPALLQRGIFLNNFETAVFDALPGQVLQVVMSSPSGLVTMGLTQVAKLVVGTVSVQRVQQS